MSKFGVDRVHDYTARVHGTDTVFILVIFTITHQYIYLYYYEAYIHPPSSMALPTSLNVYLAIE